MKSSVGSWLLSKIAWGRGLWCATVCGLTRMFAMAGARGLRHLVRRAGLQCIGARRAVTVGVIAQLTLGERV
jgi:hypothetical protein